MNIKPIKFIIFILLSFLNFNLANAQEVNLTEEEKKWIEEHPVINVAGGSGSPPVQFTRNNESFGYSIDYMRLIARKTGLKFNFINEEQWFDSFDKIQNKDIDIIHGISRTAERDLFLNFTQPYLTLPFVYFGRKGSAPINKIEDLEGLRIGVISGSAASKLYQNDFPQLNLIYQNNQTDGLYELSNGSIDVFITQELVGNYILGQNFISDIEVIGNSFISNTGQEETLRLAIHKDLPILYEIITKAAAGISDQEMINITNKWLISNNEDVGLSEEEKKWIEEHPVINVAGGSGSPPVQFTRNNESFGYSIDYMRLIARKTGLNFNFITEERWFDSFDKIKNREIDIIHTITQTSDREEFLDFTDTYLDFPFVYFGRKGSPPINKTEDLEGLRIGVIEDWATTKLYQNDYPHLNLIYQSSQTDALYELSSGSVDVVILKDIVGNFILEQNFISNIKIIGNRFIPEIRNRERLRLAIHKDLPNLHSIVTKGAAAITDQEISDISDKWLLNESPDIGLSEEEKEWLRLHNTINLAMDPNDAPIQFIDLNGNISGIGGEYINIISKKLNVKFQWVGNETLSEGIDKIKAGEIDILLAVAVTPDRSEFLTFADSYLNMVNVIFARSDKTAFGNLQTLSGRTLAQVKNFASTEYLKTNYPDIEVVEVRTIAEALHMVNDGKADAYVGNILTASTAIAAESLVQIVVVGETPYQPKIGIGTRKDLPLLASAIQKSMQSISDVEHAAISKKWLAMAIEQIENYDLLWKVIAAAFIILLIFFIWNNSLRREIKRRKKAEINMRLSQHEAEQANSAKSAFLANMSHEIRTPLNAIIGFSDVMSSGMFGKIENKRYNEYLQDIKNSGKHLATVINDILDLSKIEAGKWHLNETDFSFDDCIDSCIKMFLILAEKKNIRLSYHFSENSSGLIIHGDEHCIKRAIINLLSNAIKFTNNNGSVTCDITCNNNGDLLVEIKDTGIGIPDERIEHVINPFGQIHDDEHLNEEGTGLGLSIVKNLIELHSGQFTLKSTIDVGTQVCIHIPSDRVLSKRAPLYSIANS